MKGKGMDIHHEMIVHNTPEKVYEALTRAEDLAVWWGAPVAGRSEVGAVIEIQFDRNTMKLAITGLEEGRLVQWRVIQGMWPIEGITAEQVMTWRIEPYETNALVSL